MKKWDPRFRSFKNRHTAANYGDDRTKAGRTTGTVFENRKTADLPSMLMPFRRIRFDGGTLPLKFGNPPGKNRGLTFAQTEFTFFHAYPPLDHLRHRSQCGQWMIAKGSESFVAMDATVRFFLKKKKDMKKKKKFQVRMDRRERK